MLEEDSLLLFLLGSGWFRAPAALFILFTSSPSNFATASCPFSSIIFVRRLSELNERVSSCFSSLFDWIFTIDRSDGSLTILLTLSEMVLVGLTEPLPYEKRLSLIPANETFFLLEKSRFFENTSASWKRWKVKYLIFSLMQWTIFPSHIYNIFNLF